jgi:hypothetical protein
LFILLKIKKGMMGLGSNKGKNEHLEEDDPERKDNNKGPENANIVKSDSPERTKDQQSPVQVRPSGKMDAPDTTATLQPLTNADPQDWLGSNRDPDVMLSVPNLGIDHIGLNVKNVHAHIDLQAQVLDLVKLHVGADIGIEEVDLQINNVRVQAMLKVKLEKVREIVGDVVGLLDHHPEILSNLTGGLGRGLEGALSGKRGEVDQLTDQEKAELRKMLQESDKKQQQESDKKPQQESDQPQPREQDKMEFQESPEMQHQE